MTYLERLSDNERMQTYAELVSNSMACYPGGEGAVIAELLSSNHVEASPARPAKSRFSWGNFVRLPLFGLPSLT